MSTQVSRFTLLPRRVRASLPVLLIAASGTAAVSWVGASHGPLPTPSVRIVAVRPLQSPNPELRDLISHTFAIRVRVDDWKLLPYEPGMTARDNRSGQGYWRLYLDGRPLRDIPGDNLVAYAYLIPGDHWIAAELSQADSTSLDPPVWSEPVVLHVPRVISCSQVTARGSAEGGAPRDTCRHPRQLLTVQPAAQSLPVVTAADLWWIPPGVRLLDQLLGDGHSYKSMAWP